MYANPDQLLNVHDAARRPRVSDSFVRAKVRAGQRRLSSLGTSLIAGRGGVGRSAERGPKGRG
jgi:hypothetical protein